MKIAINIEFVKGSAPMGTGTQVYALRMADYLSKKHSVTIFIHKSNLSYINIEDLFDYYKLSSHFKKTVRVEYFGTKTRKNNISFYKHYKKIIEIIDNNYDLFIQGNTGILEGAPNTKSIHIMHFPSNSIQKPKKLNKTQKKIWEKIDKDQKRYINSYDLYLCNSQFTKKAFQQLWGSNNNAKVVYPPVLTKTVSERQIKNKNNIITTVGRIYPDKKILEMAQTFACLNEKYKNFKFIILGQVYKKTDPYYLEIKKVLKNSNYEIIENPSFSTVEKYLATAKLYWHAKGYNVKYKYQLEHFGMSTIEAMAKGCVPIVINGGGQVEIVKRGCGYRWDTLDELAKYSDKLINDDNLRIKLAKNSVERSKNFNLEAFSHNLNKSLEHI